MIIDLHTHSYYSSDGRLTIPELLDYYSKGDIVALTDHETIGGWSEFKTEANKRGIQPVLGLEWFAGEHHILCYFLKDAPNIFFKYMAERRKKEKMCMLHVFSVLKKKYTHLPSYEEIMKVDPHPEKILSVSALANSISKISKKPFKEAVHDIRKTRRNLPEEQQQETFFANEIIAKINFWEAVSILAHPYYVKDIVLTDKEIRKKIRAFAKIKIQGAEAISGRINEKMENQILTLCDELSILLSIGSDFHYVGKGLEPKLLKGVKLELKQRVEKWVINKPN